MGAVIALRIVHIGAGVFWAGGVLFLTFIVGPAMGGAGPEGFRVMHEMHRRHYFDRILTAGVEMGLASSPEAWAAIAPRMDAARARLIAVGTVGSLFVVIAVLAMATARSL